MPTLDETDNRRSILADGFRLAFRWTGDRWTHTLDLAEGDRLRRTAWALEGEADPTRVVSPTFQDLQFQRPPDDPEALQALLVGQSGPHHFSAVFTVREAPGLVRVAVEVADRCRAEVAALASTYVVDLPPVLILDAGPSAVSWLVEPESVSLTIEAEPPGRIDLREARHRDVHVQAAARVTPACPTHSWSYSWLLRLGSHPDSAPGRPAPISEKT